MEIVKLFASFAPDVAPQPQAFRVKFCLVAGAFLAD
jgi:hypothetical protein